MITDRTPILSKKDGQPLSVEAWFSVLRRIYPRSGPDFAHRVEFIRAGREPTARILNQAAFERQLAEATREDPAILKRPETPMPGW